MEKEVADLQESTNLFDVTIPDYREIKLCRREITVLKELWDSVVYVRVSSLNHTVEQNTFERLICTDNAAITH